MLPDFESFLCALIVKQEIDFMNSLLVWSSEPKRELCRLPRLQRVAVYWNLHHTRQLTVILSWNQHLWRPRGRLGERDRGFIRWAVFSGVGAEGCEGRSGLAAKGEEMRVRGHHSETAQSNTADVAELNISLSDFTTQQSRGKLQEEDLGCKQTQNQKMSDLDRKDTSAKNNQK